MRSVIGADQIDNTCDLCGAKMDLDDLEAGCPECGGEASQDNRYAKMIDDFDLLPNDEGDYELPGLLAFENHSAAYEYAQNVPGGEIVAYKGEELYYGMQEPDTDWDEFLVDPKTRFRDAANVTLKKQSDTDLWKILGRSKPLEKAYKYVTADEAAALSAKGVKIEETKRGKFRYEPAPQRTSLTVQPKKIQAAVKDLFAEGMDAKMITTELEEKHGVKVHPETVNRFLEREGVETTRVPRKTVSRADITEREQTISEQSKQIEDMGGEIDTLKDDVKFYKDKYIDLDQKNTEMTLQISNLRAAVDALKTHVHEGS
jgi:transposase